MMHGGMYTKQHPSDPRSYHSSPRDNSHTTTSHHILPIPQAEILPQSTEVPQHLTFTARDVTVPNFSKMKLEVARGGHTGSVNCVAWSCDGRRLASASDDKTIRIWSSDKSLDVKSSMQLLGHKEAVVHLDWDPLNPNLICSTSTDSTMICWDVTANPQCIDVIQLPEEGVQVCYNPMGRYVLVEDLEGSIHFVDLNIMAIVSVLEKPKDEPFMFEARWNNSGTAVYVGTSNGKVNMVSWPDMQTKQSISAHSSICYCLRMDPIGRYFATGGSDGNVVLWSLKDLWSLTTWKTQILAVRAIDFTQDGEFIASASEVLPDSKEDSAIYIHAVETGQTLVKIPAGCKQVNSLAWHPSKPVLAFTGRDSDKKRPPAVTGDFRVWGLAML